MVSWEIRTGPRASLEEGMRRSALERLQMLSAIQELLFGPTCPVRQLIPLITLLTAIAKRVHIDGLPHQADTVTVDEQLETT